MINIIGLLKLIPGNYCRKFRLDPSWDGRGNMIAPWAPTGSALETKKENVQKKINPSSCSHGVQEMIVPPQMDPPM